MQCTLKDEIDQERPGYFIQCVAPMGNLKRNSDKGLWENYENETGRGKEVSSGDKTNGRVCM